MRTVQEAERFLARGATRLLYATGKWIIPARLARREVVSCGGNKVGLPVVFHDPEARWLEREDVVWIGNLFDAQDRDAAADWFARRGVKAGAR